MVRESIVQLVFFIAVLSVATASVGVLTAETALYSQSVEDETDRDVATMDAEIAVINDPRAGTTHDRDAGTVTLYVKNVGGSTLEPESADVLVDGEYVENASVRVLDGDGWRRGGTLEITANRSLEPGDHRVLVRIDGAQDLLAFEHRIAFWLNPEEYNPGLETLACDSGTCTVDVNETETLTLAMGTDPAQTGESVAYSVDETAVATVDPAGGVTDGAGENETTLHLESEGTVAVALDTGWDEDELVVTVTNSSDGG